MIQNVSIWKAGATIDKCMIKVGMPMEEVGKLHFDDSKLHHVAAKCGVFAETDIVNLVKSGIPSAEIMCSLADAIVMQNLSVLTRGNTLRHRVLLLGQHSQGNCQFAGIGSFLFACVEEAFDAADWIAFAAAHRYSREMEWLHLPSQRWDTLLEKITDEVAKLVIPYRRGATVNCFFLRGEKGYTVIDTGIYSEEAVQLWEDLLNSGITIEQVVITHAHPDHVGMAGWLKQRAGIPVVMSRIGHEVMRSIYQESLELTKNGEDPNRPNAFYLKHGGPSIPEKRYVRMMSALYVEPDFLFEDGQQVRLGTGDFQAVWTPGHSADHFCFYNRQDGCLIAGDHVLGDISPVIIIDSEEDENPLLDYAQSLDRIRDFPVKMVLPGHGATFGSLQQRITEIWQSHVERMEQMREWMGERSVTAGELSRLVYQNPDGKGNYLAQFQTTLARLLYLQSQGKVASQERDGQVLFAWNG